MTNQTLNSFEPWVKDIPDHIKPKYLRFVLIDGDVNAPGLPEDDGDTLYITTNWAAWCRSLKDEKHCLHYEAGLFNWTERGAPVNNFIDEVINSICPQSGDPTFVMGASVLDSLQGITVNIGRIFLRLDAALNSLINTFEPTEIVFYGMTFEKRDLSPEYVAKAVEIISSRQNCSFQNMSAAIKMNQKNISQKKSSFPANFKNAMRKILIEVYVKSISSISWLRKRVSSQKHNVLIQPTGTMINPLLESYKSENVSPVFLARQVPKNIKLALKCILKGVLLVESPICKSTPQSVEITQSVIRKLNDAWSSDEETNSSLSTFMRFFVRKHLIETGEFQNTIEQFFAFDAFIEAHKIQRIVCSGFLNPQAMIFLQLAQKKGIHADDILHGLRVNHQRYPQLRRNHTQPPLVPRLLAWGQQNEDWLADLESETKSIHIGYPGLPNAPTKPKALRHANRQALVLPFEPDRDNIVGLHGHSFAALAEIINVLVSDNYDVTIKVHPGMKYHTYVDLVELFGLNCKVLQKGDFLILADNADIIIGPMNTSAMIQALAIGKSYYPCAIPPTIDEPSYILGHKPSTNGQDFADALSQSRYLDNQKILTYFCVTSSQEEVLNRFWHAMTIDKTNPSESEKAIPSAPQEHTSS